MKPSSRGSGYFSAVYGNARGRCSVTMESHHKSREGVRGDSLIAQKKKETSKKKKQKAKNKDDPLWKIDISAASGKENL